MLTTACEDKYYQLWASSMLCFENESEGNVCQNCWLALPLLGKTATAFENTPSPSFVSVRWATSNGEGVLLKKQERGRGGTPTPKNGAGGEGRETSSNVAAEKPP